MRSVTKKDVADAAMIAELLGGADVADAPFRCIEPPEPRKLHDCPDCSHEEHVDECEHVNEWDCVVAAVGASPRAHDLWITASNALCAMSSDDREAELRYIREHETMRKLKEREQLYAWVDTFREGGIDHDDIGLDGLEVAAILRDGHLPPGWKVVTTKKRKHS